MDDDIEELTREELLREVRRLRAGIRAHRDSSGHELCWHHTHYREALDRELPDAPRTDVEFE